MREDEDRPFLILSSTEVVRTSPSTLPSGDADVEGFAEIRPVRDFLAPEPSVGTVLEILMLNPEGDRRSWMDCWPPDRSIVKEKGSIVPPTWTLMLLLQPQP